MCGRVVKGREVEGGVCIGGVTDKEGDMVISLVIELVLTVSDVEECNAEGEKWIMRLNRSFRNANRSNK